MSKFKKKNRFKGQGMVEFALTLPILLVLVFGLIEFGRLLFIYMVVNNAAREAARYGISIGDGTVYSCVHTERDVVTQRFYDCDGIRAAALKSGKLAGMKVGQIHIHYDHGPGEGNEGFPLDANGIARCYWLRHVIIEHPVTFSPEVMQYGDRIKIIIAVPYKPIVSYLWLDIPEFRMFAYANRTVVRRARVAPGPAP